MFPVSIVDIFGKSGEDRCVLVHAFCHYRLWFT